MSGQGGQIEQYEEVHGRGVIAHGIDGDIHAGRPDWIAELAPHSQK